MVASTKITTVTINTMFNYYVQFNVVVVIKGFFNRNTDFHFHFILFFFLKEKKE